MLYFVSLKSIKKYELLAFKHSLCKKFYISWYLVLDNYCLFVWFANVTKITTYFVENANGFLKGYMLSLKRKNMLFITKSQSNFWLSFQKFLYAGIAYCYRLFRHFLLWKIFSNLLISPYVLVFKSSMWSSKFSVYYLCNQPLHFCYRRFGSRMRVIVQRHIDVGMSHDVLQCLWVHSCIC